MSDSSTGPANRSPTDRSPTDPSPTVLYDPPPPQAPAPTSPQPAPPTSAPLPPLAPPPTVRSRRGDPGWTGTVLFGLILVAVGLWFFADQTLGLEMPRLRWNDLWPIALILLGGWILLGSMRRR